MDFSKVHDWIQIVGLFGIMASLVFVGLQVRQTQAIGEGEMASNFMEQTLLARSMLADHADVWRKGCMDEQLSAADQAKFAQLYRAYVQATYFGWIGARNGILELDPDEVIYAYAVNIHRYPGFAKSSASFREWAAEGMKHESETVAIFTAAGQRRLAELEEINPEPSFDAKWCGM